MNTEQWKHNTYRWIQYSDCTCFYIRTNPKNSDELATEYKAESTTHALLQHEYAYDSNLCLKSFIYWDIRNLRATFVCRKHQKLHPTHTHNWKPNKINLHNQANKRILMNYPISSKQNSPIRKKSRFSRALRVIWFHSNAKWNLIRWKRLTKSFMKKSTAQLSANSPSRTQCKADGRCFHPHIAVNMHPWNT